MLFITLPSGRRLAYVKPRIGENQFGGESVTYEGTGSAKRWERLESYGPKFVENIVQGISRDILAYSMEELKTRKSLGIFTMSLSSSAYQRKNWMKYLIKCPFLQTGWEISIYELKGMNATSIKRLKKIRILDRIADFFYYWFNSL